MSGVSSRNYDKKSPRERVDRTSLRVRKDFAAGADGTSMRVRRTHAEVREKNGVGRRHSVDVPHLSRSQSAPSRSFSTLVGELFFIELFQQPLSVGGLR